MSDEFTIEILDLYWINGEKDNHYDLCLHGDVYVKIGNEIVADKYSCTVSSTALYLLKSIEDNHIHGVCFNEMLPCCGNCIIINDIDDDVEIMGCGNFIDWSVIHTSGYVTLVTDKGSKVNIELTQYKKIVFNFADKIEAFYNKCTEKNMPKDEYDYEGYTRFWREWKKRRNK